MDSPRYNTLILDLGGVLFLWSTQTKTSISSRTLKSILSSPPWREYERGRITKDECHSQVGERFSLQPSEVAEALSQAGASLQSNDSLISLVHELKEASNGTLRVYAMSNVSKADYIVLTKLPVNWSVFDQVFISGDVGTRKPDLSFYRHVLEATHTAPQDALFVDDQFENIFAARSLGLHSILFDNTASASRKLRNLLGDPVRRGKEFLSRHAQHLDSSTDSHIVVHENFAQILILCATKDESLIKMERHARTWNFFIGKPILTTSTYPDDLDTTSLALTVLDCDREMVASVMDEMLQYVTDDGIVMVYFDHERPRTDPVVCANVLSLFYQQGRGHQLGRTLQWVYEVLLHRAYLDGTFYYESPDFFLFCLGRLLSCTDDTKLHQLLKPLLKDRLRERIGRSGSGLSLAMRLLSCKVVGLTNQADLDELLSQQCEDGGWGLDWMYRYPTSGVKLGNRGVTTAFAISAIEAATKHC